MKIKLAFLWIYENFFNGLVEAKVSETEASSCVPAARLVPSMSDADAAADVQDTLTICSYRTWNSPLCSTWAFYSTYLLSPLLAWGGVQEGLLFLLPTLAALSRNRTHSPLGKVLSLSAHGLRGLSHPYKDTSQVALTPLSGM